MTEPGSVKFAAHNIEANASFASIRNPGKFHMSWSSWKPSTEQPWDMKRVRHLHRRAGFAPNWTTIQTSLQNGPDSTLISILETPPSSATDEFEAMATTIGEAAVGSQSADRLRAWWIYRMMMTPYPLVERMTLLWHNHFATSNDKVNDVAAMYEQNNLLRNHCLGKFSDLLPAVVKHPAMLSWLDASSNRREHPNENLARELMELFTLGDGNFLEQDVPEAARCLTGWTVRGDRFQFVPEIHDSGEKVVLQHKASMDGDALLKLLLKQPATAKRIAWRLCQMFFGEGIVSELHLNELASDLYTSQLDIRRAVDRILRSELFFSDENIRSRISSPAEYMIGAIRALEMESRPPSTLILSEQFRRLGQDLFHPPNVFGWKEGRSWINTRSVLAREQFASALVAGKLGPTDSPLDVRELPRRHKDFNQQEQILQFYSELICGHQNGVERGGDNNDAAASESAKLDRLVAGMISHPESQLS